MVEPERVALDDSMEAGAAAQIAATSSTVLLQGPVPMPPKLRVTGDLGQNWKKLKQVWNSYEVVSRLNKQAHDYRVATFITCIGSEALEIYNALPFESEHHKMNMGKVLRLMEVHYVGKTNIIYERFQFQSRLQQTGETAEQYITVLRALAQTSQFGASLDERVRDQLVFGVRENGLRKQLLQVRDLALAICVDMCRAFEATTTHMRVMTGGTPDVVDAVEQSKHTKSKPPGEKSLKKSRKHSRPTYQGLGEGMLKEACNYCGYVHERGKCPAYGKNCAVCNKPNHFAKVCRGKGKPQRKQTVHATLDDYDDADNEDKMFSLTLTPDEVNSLGDSAHQKRILATMMVDTKVVKFQVDTDATYNVMRLSDLPPGKKLEPVDKVLTMYNGTKMKAHGKYVLNVRNPKTKQKHRVEFVVVKQRTPY